MPREKEFIKLVPKIYRRNAEDLGLFFWIRAQKDIVPTITIEQAILSYFRELGVSVDDWDMITARQTYTRMQHEFYDKCRENTKKD
jgi:hypothetical protein